MLRTEWFNKMKARPMEKRWEYLHDHCPGMRLQDIQSFCGAMMDLAEHESPGDVKVEEDGFEEAVVVAEELQTETVIKPGIPKVQSKTIPIANKKVIPQP